jgi:hypothetical protein
MSPQRRWFYITHAPVTQILENSMLWMNWWNWIYYI